MNKTIKLFALFLISVITFSCETTAQRLEKQERERVIERAEKERENIAFRLAQGRQLAIEKGVKMGRREGSIKTLDQLSSEYAAVIKSLKRGQTIRNTAKICGVSVSTVQRVKKAFNL